MTLARHIFILVILSGAIFATPAHAVNCDRKPDHPQCEPPPPPPPPPPPTDDGAICADSDGEFPAFAYKTETVTGKRRKKKTTTDFFVANSTGDCTIKVFSTSVPTSHPDFRQRADGVGRIVWSQENSVGSDYPTIRLIEFDVTDRVIDTALPLTQSIIHTVPVAEAVGAGAPVLADNSDRVIFTVGGSDGNGGWINYLNITDISTACSPCMTTRILELFSEEFFPLGDGLAMNEAEDRIFFSTSEPVLNPFRRLSFIQNENGVWSAPVEVINNNEPGFEGWNFRELDVAAYSSGSGEILAFHYEENGVQTAVKIIGTGSCTVDPARIGSCFSAGLSTEIAHLPFTAVPTFTEVPYGNTGAPSLTIQAIDNGDWTFYNADLDDFNLELIPDMPNERLVIGQ